MLEFPHEEGFVRKAHNIQEVETMGQVARTVPRIYAALEDRQEDHQSTVVEVTGKIIEQSVSILIDLGSTHSYITPRVVDICAFKKVKHRKSWLVQLATGTKRKVSEVVEKCPLVMNGLVTCVDMNVLPLGSYDVLIGMDWLESHRVKLDCYNNTFECMNEEGNPVVVKGIPKVISVRQVSTMQLKKFCRKGFQLYAAHILEETEKYTPRLEDYQVL